MMSRVCSDEATAADDDVQVEILVCKRAKKSLKQYGDEVSSSIGCLQMGCVQRAAQIAA